MDCLSVRCNLRKVSREEHGTIKTRIERAQVVYVVVFDHYPSQNFVPTGLSFTLYSIEVSVFQLFEILLRLLYAYERRGHPKRHFLSFFSFETHQGAAVRGLRFDFLAESVICESAYVFEWGVGFYHEPILEIGRDSA